MWESSALFLLSLGMVVLWRWLQELLAKYSVDRLNQNGVVWKENTLHVEKKAQNIKSSSQLWNMVDGHHGLRLICCLRAKKDCCHWWKNERKNLRPSVCKLKVNRGLVSQRDNDPKYWSKSTTEWLQWKKIRLLGWPSPDLNLSPELNMIEMLFHDLKWAIHPNKIKIKIAELKKFCTEEWSKILANCCADLICIYRKYLVEVIAAKLGSTSYYIQRVTYFFHPAQWIVYMCSIKNMKTYHVLCSISLSKFSDEDQNIFYD